MPAPSIDRYLEELRTPDEKGRVLRADAARGLAQFKDPRSLEPLISALRDSCSTVRKAAAFALGELADLRAYEPLLKAKAEEEGFNDSNVMEAALCKLGDPRYAAKMLELARDEYVSHAAVTGLFKLLSERPEQARPEILQAIAGLPDQINETCSYDYRDYASQDRVHMDARPLKRLAAAELSRRVKA